MDYKVKVGEKDVAEYFKLVDSYFVLEGASKGLVDKWYKKLITDFLYNDVNRVIAKHLFNRDGYHQLWSEHYSMCKKLYLDMYEMYPFAKEMLDLICVICDKEIEGHKKLERYVLVMRREFPNVFEGKDIKDMPVADFFRLLENLEDEYRPLA